MPSLSQAEEHLRVIRSLMERATNYRAISAQAALLGGGLSLVVGGYFWWRAALPLTAPAQTLVWLGVLAVTAGGNFLFLFGDARRRKEIFVSAGMRMALRALAPSFLIAGAATAQWADQPEVLALVWSGCYALGLLATSHFAPRSIALLGWAFLAASLVDIFAPFSCLGGWTSLSQKTEFFNGYMAVTFGFFHIVYASCVWRRGSGSDALPSDAPQ